MRGVAEFLIMEIPSTGSPRSASSLPPSARAKADESAEQPIQPDSPTASQNPSILQQASASSNPAAAASLTQQQADTARVILKGPPPSGTP
jgi:hypothetical protein